MRHKIIQYSAMFLVVTWLSTICVTPAQTETRTRIRDTKGEKNGGHDGGRSGGSNEPVQHPAEQVEFVDEGRQRTAKGRILLEAADGGIMLQADDGALWIIQPEELR